MPNAPWDTPRPTARAMPSSSHRPGTPDADRRADRHSAGAAGKRFLISERQTLLTNGAARAMSAAARCASSARSRPTRRTSGISRTQLSGQRRPCTRWPICSGTCATASRRSTRVPSWPTTARASVPARPRHPRSSDAELAAAYAEMEANGIVENADCSHRT